MGNLKLIQSYPDNPLYALKGMIDQLILQDEKQKQLEDKVELIDSKYEEKFQVLEEEKQNSAISSKDAFHIKELIDDIAYYLARLKGQDRPDKKQFSFVYGRFKKRYEIPKYSMLAQKDYDGAVRFLITWRDDLKDHFN